VAGVFERKNVSFNKLKEKLTTTASISNGMPEVATNSERLEMLVYV